MMLAPLSSPRRPSGLSRSAKSSALTWGAGGGGREVVVATISVDVVDVVVW
jgi:hypothetical protein